MFALRYRKTLKNCMCKFDWFRSRTYYFDKTSREDFLSLLDNN